MSKQETPTDAEALLDLFSGGTGGIDSWLTGDHRITVVNRLNAVRADPISCSQLNQLLALSRQPEMSDGCFRYYWLTEPTHSYDVSAIPGYSEDFRTFDRIVSLEHLAWGLCRLYTDALLFFGGIANGYRELRNKSFGQLTEFYEQRRYDTDAMIHRGPPLPLELIAQDQRYLIAEQACKSFEPAEGAAHSLRMVLKGAWEEHRQLGGGRVTAKQLLEGSYVLKSFGESQQQFLFAADELLDSVVESEKELIEKYEAIACAFSDARCRALSNTSLYLSMANDLDVYVATSMRTRDQFREMAQACDRIFSHPAVRHLNLRYFDPTLSAARGHEDKGLLECLMVKSAKVLIYTAGEDDSYGKDAEAAMAMSLGKPVIFFCSEERRRRFFGEIHPLSRLIDFRTGVAVGAMATSSVETVSLLLGRIFENRMEYELEQPRRGYFRLRERLTKSTVRLQTDDTLLRETFWNCYHKPRDTHDSK